MREHARLFNCLRCHAQVIICSHCDRGNIYCSATCANSARVNSLRVSNQRYQKTPRGRLLHARRQQRYRTRLKTKVTEQGSLTSPQCDVLINSSDKAIKHSQSPIKTEVWCCRFCCNGDFVTLRNDFLSRAPAKKRVLSSWPSGP